MKALLRFSPLYRLLQSALVPAKSMRRFVDEYTPIRPGCRVLDIGCGPASVLEYLPESVAYTGFDSNQDYIESAKRTYGKRGEFRVCSVEEFNIGPEVGRYDVVLAMGVLHHLNDASAAQLICLAEQALCTSGKFVSWDCTYADQQPIIARFLARIDRGKFVRTPVNYTALATAAFGQVDCLIVEDMLRVPFTHAILRCSR